MLAERVRAGKSTTSHGTLYSSPMNPFLLAGLLAALTVALVLFLDRQFPGVLSRDDNQIELISRLVVLAALAGSLTLGLRREGLGPVLRSALAWIGVGLVLVTGYSFRDELEPVWRRVAGNLVPAQPVSLAPGVAALRAGTGGHFHAVAEVEAARGAASQRVRFMVDTGASDVALTRDDAKRLGIDVERLRFDVPYSTANGPSMGARVRLERVTIGDIALDNVAGSVVSGRLEQSLLGMSFLRRLTGFEIHGDVLILRQ